MKRFAKPIIAVLVFIVMQAIAGAVLLLFGDKDKNGVISHPTVLALSIIISGLLTIFVLYRMRMFSLRTFDPRRINWNYAHLGLIGAMVGIFATNLISEMFHLPDFMQTEFLGLAHSLLGVLAIAVVGPIVEETVFRAGVLGYLVRHDIGRWTAIGISALAFGLIHFNPAQIPFATIVGVLLGIVYVKSRSIILTSIIHILNNSIAVWELRKFGDTIDDFSITGILGSRLTLIYIVVCYVLCYVFMREFIKKYHRRHNINKKRHHHHHH